MRFFLFDDEFDDEFDDADADLAEEGSIKKISKAPKHEFTNQRSDTLHIHRRKLGHVLNNTRRQRSISPGTNQISHGGLKL